MSRKPKKKHARRRARENALAILYSSDIIESDAVRIVEDGLYPSGDIKLSEYAEMLVEGVSSHLEEIDEKLMASSENWALDRMPVVDRAILRLAVFEMLYVDEVPVSVSINEAVELAKAYGGEDESSRFVNGVLGRISRLEDAAASASEPILEEGADADGEAAELAQEGAGADAEAAAPAQEGADEVFCEDAEGVVFEEGAELASADQSEGAHE